MDLLRTIQKGEAISFIVSAREFPLRDVPRRIRDLRRLVLYHDHQMIVRDIDWIIVYPAPTIVHLGRKLPGVMKARCIVKCKKGRPLRIPAKKGQRGFPGFRYGYLTADGKWRSAAGRPSG